MCTCFDTKHALYVFQFPSPLSYALLPSAAVLHCPRELLPAWRGRQYTPDINAKAAKIHTRRRMDHNPGDPAAASSLHRSLGPNKERGSFVDDESHPSLGGRDGPVSLGRADVPCQRDTWKPNLRPGAEMMLCASRSGKNLASSSASACTHVIDVGGNMRRR